MYQKVTISLPGCGQPSSISLFPFNSCGLICYCPLYLSLSIPNHNNHSTHQSAHPCCFLICSHPQGPSPHQNYSEERSPHLIRTPSGMHTRGSFPEPLQHTINPYTRQEGTPSLAGFRMADWLQHWQMICKDTSLAIMVEMMDMHCCLDWYEV